MTKENQTSGFYGELAIFGLVGTGLFMSAIVTGLMLYSSMLQGNLRYEQSQIIKRGDYIVQRKQEFLKELSKPENQFNSALVDSVMKYYNEEVSIDSTIQELQNAIWRAKLKL